MEILVYLLLVVAGGVIGLAVGRLSSDKSRAGKVEAERDAAKQALADYRQQVTDHFQHTGELFDQITADYRSLYEHLASGATELCDAPRQDVLQAEPERRRLTEAVTDTEAGTDDAGDPPGSATASSGPDPARAGVAGAAVGAAAAGAAATPAHDRASEEPEAAKSTAAPEVADPPAQAAHAAESSAAAEGAIPAADSAAETPVLQDAGAADGDAREDVKDGDGQAATSTAADEHGRDDETDDKPALAVNGHYRAEGEAVGRKAGAP